MILAEITKELIGMTLNEGKIFVLKITDGTMATVANVIYRYKFPIRGGYLRDKEENIIIKESKVQLFGYVVPGTGKKVGTELIDVRCADPDDKHVWWVENPRFITKIIDRDPVTHRNITVTSLIEGSGTSKVGTYEEFLEVVNRDKNVAVADAEPPDPIDVPELSELDDDYIKDNYEKMTDAEMADYFKIEEKVLKDYRLKTLGLKRKPFGVK